MLRRWSLLWQKRFGIRHVFAERTRTELEMGEEKVVKLPKALEVDSVDFSQFQENVTAFGIALKTKDIGPVMRDLREVVLRMKTQKNVIPVDAEGEKAILFNPETITNMQDLEKALQGNPVLEKLKSAAQREIFHSFTIGYEELSTEKALRKLIPAELDQLPSSFEQIGHIAHLNLREEYLPYRRLIGKVIMDKNKVVETVVTKTSQISNVFRTFPMEIIAGRDNFDVVIKEHGATFKFNYAKVYWNSRLSDEHQRLVERFSPTDVVVDGFCGVGPFAIPAAIKGCTVLANDLNPDSYEALRENVALNNVSPNVKASNEDARTFLRRVFLEEKTVAQHVVMNLPATAIEFLDAFRAVFPSDVYEGPAVSGEDEKDGEEPSSKRQKTTDKAMFPVIHCYCFSNCEDYRTDLLDRVEAALGATLDHRDQVEIRHVRHVAPKKHMYCIHLHLPARIALAP